MFKENEINQITKLEKFQESDSGLALYEIFKLKINMNNSKPTNIGISTFVKVPIFIQNNKAVLNIQTRILYISCGQT